ncbi:MAG: hypothetical protein AAF170_18140 [Bacteroidota bacterium]
MRQRFVAFVEAHPRWMGAALAGLLLVSYLGAVRPVRDWSAAHIAKPVFESIDTPTSQSLQLVTTPQRPEAVFALPVEITEPSEIQDRVRQPDVAQWVAPAGILFLLPAMFLIAAFPLRPFWLYLLGYHVVVGVISFGVFALGIAYVEAAFELYRFSRTYLTEAVSLGVPALIWLRARGFGGQDDP